MFSVQKSSEGNVLFAAISGGAGLFGVAFPVEVLEFHFCHRSSVIRARSKHVLYYIYQILVCLVSLVKHILTCYQFVH